MATHFDQMFTAENFRRIFDTENRKGTNLVGMFFPALEPHSKKVKEKTKELRLYKTQRTQIPTAHFKQTVESMQEDLRDLKSEKSKAINGEMEKLSLLAMKASFKLQLTRTSGPKDKPLFCVDRSPEAFFVVKQLQYNICKIYKVKQANRHQLTCQLRDTIDGSFPFEVVRTDISSFYESIDREGLLESLDTDQLLSPLSKKYIRQLLHSYADITGEARGIPRGVGISAYLAELYLRPFDAAIRAIRGLVLYCRFVDDIAVVFARPQTGESLGSYKDIVIEILRESKLTHNPLKTKEFPADKEIDYLGYRFSIQNGSLNISPSEAKIKKLKARICAVFDEYDTQHSVNCRRAFRDLVQRVKFLTGNCRLYNSKASATTGIYYGNPIVTDTSKLIELDQLLKKRVLNTKRPTLKQRLKQYTFVSGFQERRFHNFGPKELRRIVRVWKHD